MFRNIVPTFGNTQFHPFDSELYGRKLKKVHNDLISLILPTLNILYISFATKRCLKCKRFIFSNTLLDLFNHQQTSFNSHFGRLKRCKSLCNQIGINKVQAFCLYGEKFICKCCFTCTVGARQYVTFFRHNLNLKFTPAIL